MGDQQEVEDSSQDQQEVEDSSQDQQEVEDEKITTSGKKRRQRFKGEIQRMVNGSLETETFTDKEEYLKRQEALQEEAKQEKEEAKAKAPAKDVLKDSEFDSSESDSSVPLPIMEKIQGKKITTS